jgi:prepilin-type N-terminal cleavage/methylation domain-containing protein
MNKRLQSVINKKGFTLIELTVSIAIIGILAGVVLSLINPITLQKKSRDSRRKADLEAIRQALELYRADNKEYPTGGWYGSAHSSWSSFTSQLTSEYITNVPVDPVNDGTGNPGPCYGSQNYRYNYLALDSGKRYVLTAIMEIESSNDKSACDYNGWCGGHNTDDYCYQVQNP